MLDKRSSFSKRKKLGFVIGAVIVLMLVLGYQNLLVRNSFSLSNGDQQVINLYLSEEVMDPNFGGEVFSVYEVLQSNKDAGEIYIWALIEEYYETDTGLEPGTGMSVPMVLHVEQNGDLLEISNHTLPRDGSYYPEDIKTLFPRRIQSKINDYPSKNMEGLVDEMEIAINTGN